MNNFKLISNTFYWIVLSILFIIAGLTLISGLNIPGNYKFFVVQSGSMEPAIKTGSIVLIKPEKVYKKGDVITFKDSDKTNTTVTHRIHSTIENNDNKISYITKGDANKAPDSLPRPLNTVLGKEILAVPYIGFPVNFAKTKAGVLIMIIIPAILIIYSELINIKNEILKHIKKRKTRDTYSVKKIELAEVKENNTE